MYDIILNLKDFFNYLSLFIFKALGYCLCLTIVGKYVQTYNGCVYYYRIHRYKLRLAWGYMMFTGIFCCHGNGCSGLNICAKFHCLMYILV